MIIFGIDPGTARTGWGVIKKSQKLEKSGGVGIEYVAHGCIVTPKEMEMGKRLLLLRQELQKLFKSYNPNEICIERIFFGINSATAMTVGQARGVILLTVIETTAQVFEYQSLSVKRFITGSGRSDKKIVQKFVRELLNEKKRKLSFSAKDRGWDDAADALAIAIYHANIK